jgi:hypothetical protein
MNKRDLRICGIYGLHCIATDKWYIGGSLDVVERVKEHRRDHRGHIRYHVRRMALGRAHMQTSFQKRYPLSYDIWYHGWDSIKAYLLERVDDPANLSAREQYWIDRCDSKVNGYNKQASCGHRDWN